MSKDIEIHLWPPFKRSGTTITQRTASDDLSMNAGCIKWSVGKAVVGTDYSIIRDTDATNQLHFNVPTGASIEWSINDVLRMQMNSSGYFGIGAAPSHWFHVTAGTLDNQVSGFYVSGTMPPAGTGYNALINAQCTSGANGNQYAFNQDLLASGTANVVYSAGRFANAVAGTGTSYINGGSANYGNYQAVVGSTAGYNVADFGLAYNGLHNIGQLGVCTTARNGGVNIGVAGFGLNTGTIPTQIGGYFGLQNATPTYVSGALIADNGSTTSDILVARDNGSAIFTVADGALFTFNGGQTVKRTAVSDAAYTALVGDYIIAYTSLTASRTVTLPAAATAGAGKMFVIKDEAGAASTYPIVIDPNAAELIDGSATKSINTNYSALKIYCNGTAWFSM